MKATTASKPANRLTTNGDSVINPTKQITPIKRVDLEVRQMQITIQGESLLVVHAWSEKAKLMMLKKQLGIASAGKERRDPVADFKSSLYRLPGNEGFGFPAVAIKSAAVSAANDVELKKVNLRRAFHVMGDLVKIDAPPITEPITEEDVEYASQIQYEHKHGASMRSDMVRVGMGVADIRFRAQFINWKATFSVRYNARVVTVEQLTNLFNVAGFGVGICEHRPEKNGSWGLFGVS
jgi:hypothetical protein